MGGHAVLHATRLPADHYHVAAGICLTRLRAVFAHRLALIPSIRAKPDFGDIDILIQDLDLDQDSDAFAQTLGATVQVRDNPYASILSCGVPLAGLGFGDYPLAAVLQIDLIAMPSAHFESALHYFSWNDCGNLLGRVARGMGLKLGHDGLSYVLRHDTRVLDTLSLATDWDVILPALGYDAARWQAGFDTLDDMFAFVAGGHFYDPAAFLLENRNHRSRVRDAKRPSYQAFLRWAAAHPVAHPPPVRDKADGLPYFFAAIPVFQDRHDQALAEDRHQQLVKTRYNGDVVGRWTGLQGPVLGHFMRAYQDHRGGSAGLAAYVVAHTNLEVYSDIQAFKQTYETLRFR
ncbi:MAG: hypothetical protein ACYDEV_00510 [Acidiferrobacter sp.]